MSDELCLKIRDLVLQENTMDQISVSIEVPYKTLEGWVSRNYRGFADKWRLYHIERRLKKAEENIDEALRMETLNRAMTKKGDMYEYSDPKLLKIKMDTSLFVAETVGKQIYSKRNEVTGANGGPLQVELTPEQRKRIAEYELRKTSNPGIAGETHSVLSGNG